MGLITAEVSQTDVAYRTAVARLRSMLISRPSPESLTLTRTTSHDPDLKLEHPSTATLFNGPRYFANQTAEAKTLDNFSAREELLDFIDKQAQYIVQLEAETTNNRNELGQILEKVEEVVTENEALHERQKELMESVTKTGAGTDEIRITGNDSRVTELESELLKIKQSLRLSQEEVLNLRMQVSGQSRSTFNKFSSCELHLAEIEAIARERNSLIDKTTKLEESIADLKGREAEAAEKVKNSLDLLDEMRQEKSALQTQMKEQNEDITHLQNRVRQLISQNSQQYHIEGKADLDKFYVTEINRLRTELNREIEVSSQAKMDLESEKRRTRDQKNELEEKIRNLVDFKQNLEMKIETLESQLSQTLQRKTKAETEIMGLRLEAEKVEREGKHEISRLFTELTILRTQLTEINSDLKKRDQVIRELNHKISELEKRIALESKLQQEDQLKSNEEVMKLTAEAVQQKYAGERREFEQVIQKQNTLMEKLRAECYNLAQKLEEISSIYKNEKYTLETEKTRLHQSYNLALKKCSDLEQKVQYYSAGQDQMLNRVHFLEDEEKVHTQKIVTLLTKQGFIQKEKERLEGELAILKSQLMTTTESVPTQ